MESLWKIFYKKQNKKCLTFITTCIKLNIVAAIHNQLIHQLAAYRNVAQLGRALRSGRRGRVFESRRLDFQACWSSGQDDALSRRKPGFDSRTGHI